MNVAQNAFSHDEDVVACFLEILLQHPNKSASQWRGLWDQLHDDTPPSKATLWRWAKFYMPRMKLVKGESRDMKKLHLEKVKQCGGD